VKPPNYQEFGFFLLFSGVFNSPTEHTDQPILVVNGSNDVFPPTNDPFWEKIEEFLLGVLVPQKPQICIGRIGVSIVKTKCHKF
jgi:hypothetical protein